MATSEAAATAAFPVVELTKDEARQRASVLNMVYYDMKPQIQHGFLDKLTESQRRLFKKRKYTTQLVCHDAKDFLETDPAAQEVLEQLYDAIYVERMDEEDWRDDVELAATALYDAFVDWFLKGF
jgi:hypothetical protein